MTPSLRFLGAALLAALLAGPAALAQPDWTADPTFGTLSLESGFTPDPAAVDLTLGGMDENTVEADGCTGYIDAAAPSVDLSYETDGVLPLKIFLRSSHDTVLLVNTPSGAWVCNDDFDGVQAGVLFDAPESGSYSIFAGTYSPVAVGEAAATLYVTELPEVELMADGPPAETAALATGFEPDPASVTVTAGGPDANPEVGCLGFLDADAPTARLTLDTDGGLPLYVYVRSGDAEDLTLTVATPDGEVVCNDDADALDPGLVIEEPVAGDYAVWVGSYRATGRAEEAGTAELYFSEVEGPTANYDDYTDFDFGDMEYSGGEGISLFAEPAHGTLTLDPGFTPDPQSVQVEAGGPDAVSVSGPGCAGVIDNAHPDVNVIYGEGGERLAFFVEGGGDTTMLVNTPSGEWHCNDDAISLNPAVVIDAPEAGLYSVWVGTYSQDATGAPVTLHVSESDPR